MSRGVWPLSAAAPVQLMYLARSNRVAMSSSCAPAHTTAVMLLDDTGIMRRILLNLFHDYLSGCFTCYAAHMSKAEGPEGCHPHGACDLVCHYFYVCELKPVRWNSAASPTTNLGLFVGTFILTEHESVSFCQKMYSELMNRCALCLQTSKCSVLRRRVSH